MNTAKCFWLELAGTQRRFLRRYASPEGRGYTCADGWHEARVRVGDAPATFDQRGILQVNDDPAAFDDDPRWPQTCVRCEYRFTEEDRRQLFREIVYRDDGGAEYTLRDAPPGAMWDAIWRTPKGPDGRCIMVKLPDGHDWCIDGRASNCALPDDDEHRCWIRHGQPPELTVDKNGRTCDAGAGSIDSGRWHGHLRAGMLVPA